MEKTAKLVAGMLRHTIFENRHDLPPARIEAICLKAAKAAIRKAPKQMLDDIERFGGHRERPFTAKEWEENFHNALRCLISVAGKSVRVPAQKSNRWWFSTSESPAYFELKKRA